jgi:hypothetical protein
MAPVIEFAPGTTLVEDLNQPIAMVFKEDDCRLSLR